MFTTDVLVFHFVNFTKYPTNDQTVVVPKRSHASDTSELVDLLQQSAVEHLTAFRQLEAQEFGSVLGIVTTNFEALYAYKCGEYQRCLQLSTHNVCTLIDDKVSLIFVSSHVFAYPEFIQLMNDDIVALIGLTMIVNPSCRCDVDNILKHTPLSQLYLSLYLMTQCQMKLRQPVTSLAQTLDYVEVAGQRLHENSFTLDQLLLKLTERKILLYISEGGELV